MAGRVRARNVPARSDRLCRADNDALRRLPRFIHPSVIGQAKDTSHPKTDNKQRQT